MNPVACGARRIADRAVQQGIGLGQNGQQRRILPVKGADHGLAILHRYPRPHVVGAGSVRLQRCRQNRLPQWWCHVAQPLHGAQRRQQEQMAADDGRHRIARQTQHRHPADPPRHQRFAGSHRHFVERPLHPHVGCDLADQIVIADRGAADRHHQIGVQRHPEREPQALFAIGCDRQQPHPGPFGLGHRGKGKGVRGGDLIRARGFARHHQFIAGGDQGNDRPPRHRHLGQTHCRNQRQIGG